MCGLPWQGGPGEEHHWCLCLHRRSTHPDMPKRRWLAELCADSDDLPFHQHIRGAGWRDYRGPLADDAGGAATRRHLLPCARPSRLRDLLPRSLPGLPPEVPDYACRRQRECDNLPSPRSALPRLPHACLADHEPAGQSAELGAKLHGHVCLRHRSASHLLPLPAPFHRSRCRRRRGRERHLQSSAYGWRLHRLGCEVHGASLPPWGGHRCLRRGLHNDARDDDA
mmetsp:Transcript_19511/g.41559  ORF Transcript_19511/g.41559 Transcript_19511/m.41559 type:complete len:225 (-) Transcript_19511:513-1187(-)